MNQPTFGQIANMAAIIKVRKARERARIEKTAFYDAEAGSGSEEEAAPRGALTAKNAFDSLLADADEEESGDVAERGGAAPAHAAEADEEAETQQDASRGKEGNARALSSKSADRRASGKKRGGKRKQGKGGAAEPATGAGGDKSEAIEDILRELSVSEAGSAAAAEAKEEKRESQVVSVLETLLRTEARLFNPDLEIRRVFGDDVRRLRAQQVAENQRFAGGAGGPQRAGVARRATVLVRADDSWPLLEDRGLHMVAEGEGAGGVRRFRLERSPHYERVEAEYRACVSTHDPNALAHFVQRHPYHAAALLQLSQVCLHFGEAEDAATLAQRCLFTFESCFAPSFTFTSGNCRLDPSRAEHATLFEALYKYANMLGRKGCPRTALEFLKLLLSLAPERDPMCVTATMDYFMVRSREYAYLLDFAQRFPGAEGEAPARMLPNFLYSAAMARWFLDGSPDRSPVSSERVTLDLDLRTASASQLLRLALLLHPEVLPRLVSKLDERESKKPHWTRVLAAPHFVKAADRLAAYPLEAMLVKIFVERCVNLWRPEKLLTWLADHAAAVAALSPADTQPFELARAAFFRPDQRVPDKLRQLTPFDYSDAAATPLPADFGAQFRVRQQPEGFNYEMLDVANVNPAIAFLRLLLPWVHVARGAQGDPDLDDLEDEGQF